MAIYGRTCYIINTYSVEVRGIGIIGTVNDLNEELALLSAKSEFGSSSRRVPNDVSLRIFINDYFRVREVKR